MSCLVVLARVDLGWGCMLVCMLVCMSLVVSVGGRTVLVVVMVVMVDGWQMMDGGVREKSHGRAIVTYKYYIACTSLCRHSPL